MNIINRARIVEREWQRGDTAEWSQWISLKINVRSGDTVYEFHSEDDQCLGVAVVSLRTFQPSQYEMVHKKQLDIREFVELQLLEVRSDCKRLKIGTTLLHHVVKKNPDRNIILCCTENNIPAYRLYTKTGFRVLWVDELGCVPWFIRRSLLEKMLVPEIVDVLNHIYCVEDDYNTSMAGSQWSALM